MKRGSSHIDWVLSIGIFLVSIVALLLFMKPGIKEVNRDDILLNQIQENFERDVFWTVKKVPLFVNHLNPSSGTDVRQVGLEIETPGWKFSNEFEPSIYDVRFDIKFENGNRKFVLECSVASCQTNDNDGPFSLTYYSNSLDPDEPEFKDDLCNVDSTNCHAELGLTEDIKGVDVDRVNDLENKAYEVLKQEWAFPEKKDFAAFRDNIDSENKLFGGDAFEQANVFSRRVKYWELDGNAERNAMTIIFLVW